MLDLIQTKGDNQGVEVKTEDMALYVWYDNEIKERSLKPTETNVTKLKAYCMCQLPWCILPNEKFLGQHGISISQLHLDRGDRRNFKEETSSPSFSADNCEFVSLSHNDYLE